ncbi:MAG: hypothetical protein AAF526_11040 [Pseudomonadota bacterium]
MTKTYDILIAEDYEHQGETRSKFHNVGTAWPLETKDRMSVQLHPGISVSGRLVILPRKPKPEAA